jgi:nicotinamidase-related amidase
MEAISDLNPPRFDLDWDHSALLVIDMQRVFLEGSSKVQDAQALAGRVADLADAFRARGRPVLYTQHMHKEDGSDGTNLMWWWGGLIIEGTPESEISPLVAPADGDPVVRKRTYDAFTGTDLQERLAAIGVKDLVITGVMTNICCETTAREAFCRDFRVKFVADGTSTAADSMQLATLVNVAYAFGEICLTQDLLD